MLINSAIVVFASLQLVDGFRLTGLRQPFVAPTSHSSLSAATREAIIQPIFGDDEISGITLSRYMVEFVTANPQVREMESLVMSLQIACKTIASTVERAAITGVTGLQEGGGSINVQGEEQKRLDVITNDIMKKALRYSGKVGVLASEEEAAPMSVAGKNDKYKGVRTFRSQFNSEVLIEETGGKYVAVFDPLDGSSNVDAGIPTGTIFGIFENDPSSIDQCELPEDDNKFDAECIASTLQPGTSLVAAGYCLYSSSTFLCLTLGTGVNIFTLDRSIGEFILTHPNVQIPRRGKIYSFNEANRFEWDQPLVDYVTSIQQGKGETGKQYSSRYIGSMVGDVHRTLLYGGIFGYPATHKNKDGKLRLLYEAAPMSFLMEQAGGLSITGKTRIMDLKPTNVHQRVPCVMGSPEDVLEVKKHYEACKDPAEASRYKERAAW